jgi:hypothetical protein
MIGRIGRPLGSASTSIPESNSANSLSGGTRIRNSAPIPRNRTVSAANASTSPRVPYVDNNTRIS